MTALIEALGSGRIFGFVVAALILEAVALLLLGARRERGLPVATWLPTLLSGLGLALAALLVSIRADAALIGASLLLALLGHVQDLRQRARQR